MTSLRPLRLTNRMFAALSPLLLLAGAASALHIPGSVLKTAAFPKYFGAALGQGHLQNASDPKFAEFAAVQFSGATPENEMKWYVDPRSSMSVLTRKCAMQADH